MFSASLSFCVFAVIWFFYLIHLFFLSFSGFFHLTL